MNFKPLILNPVKFILSFQYIQYNFSVLICNVSDSEECHRLREVSTAPANIHVSADEVDGTDNNDIATISN